MPITKFWIAFLTFSFITTATAWADVVPPEVGACQSKKAGDSCSAQNVTSGTCTQSKCSKLDYSNGTPPKTIEVDCLKCISTSAQDAPPAQENAASKEKPSTDNAPTDKAVNPTPKGTSCSQLRMNSFEMGLCMLFLGFLGFWQLRTRKTPRD